VLDVCAGTGQFGIEALSRGAGEVAFVEADRATASALRGRLAEKSFAGRPLVVNAAAPQALARLEGAFDVTFMDPPYGTDVAAESLRVMAERGMVRPGGTVAVEHHHKDNVPEINGELHRYRLQRYGETAVSFFQPTGGSDIHA